MRITTFNPMIITKNADEVVRLFEELGFEKRHEKSNIDGAGITGIRMKNADGFHVDVAQTSLVDKGDLPVIRMNVDDFDEGYEFLTAHGFTNILGRVIDTESSRFAIMISPSGFGIDLMYHKKIHD